MKCGARGAKRGSSEPLRPKIILYIQNQFLFMSNNNYFRTNKSCLTLQDLPLFLSRKEVKKWTEKKICNKVQ